MSDLTNAYVGITIMAVILVVSFLHTKWSARH